MVDYRGLTSKTEIHVPSMHLLSSRRLLVISQPGDKTLYIGFVNGKQVKS